MRWHWDFEHYLLTKIAQLLYKRGGSLLAFFGFAVQT